MLAATLLAPAAHVAAAGLVEPIHPAPPRTGQASEAAEGADGMPPTSSWAIGWSTLDAGGGSSSAGDGAVRLSGGIGQWDVDAAGPASGGPWRLSGGFWVAGVATDGEAIFADGFEAGG